MRGIEQREQNVEHLCQTCLSGACRYLALEIITLTFLLCRLQITHHASEQSPLPSPQDHQVGHQVWGVEYKDPLSRTSHRLFCPEVS